MRRLLLLCLPLFAAPPAFAYETNAIWWAEDQLPVPVALVRPGSDDLGEDLTEELLLTALDQWADVGCTDLTYEYLGWVDEMVHMDGIVHVEWIEEDSGMGDAAASTAIDVDPDSGRIRDVNLTFNGDTLTWTDSDSNPYAGSLDAVAVMVHELGHAFGLDHNVDMLEASMFWAYTSAAGGLVSWDDKWGICSLYPRDGDVVDECETDEDCPDHPLQAYRCREIPEIDARVCEEVYDDLGACCDAHWNNCRDVLCHLHASTYAGYCTDFCDGDGDCPTGWTCDPISFLGEEMGWCTSPLDDEQPCGDDFEMPGDDDDSASEPQDDDDAEEDGCACRGDGRGERAPVAWVLLVGCVAALYRRRR